MLQTKQLISVIIPVYNAGFYLKRCLESIQQQTYQYFEVILIDDGSTDASELIYSQFVQADQRFSASKQSNQGPSAARNKGIAQAQGSYIAFIDADDAILPNYLNDLITQSIATNADLVCAGYLELSKFHKEPFPIHDFIDYKNSQLPSHQFINYIFKGTAGVLWAKLFKTSVIQQVKLQFNKAIKMSEDLIFVLEYGLASKTICITDKYAYVYNRLHEQGLSAKQDEHYLIDIVLTNTAIETILIKNKCEKTIAIEPLKAQRLWHFLMVSTHTIATASYSFIQKRTKINGLLVHKEIENYLPKFKEQQVVYKLQLFLLKKHFVSLAIMYSALIKIVVALKYYFKNYEN